MDNIETRIAGLEDKIDGMKKSLDKLNRFFFWTLIIAVITFLLPLIGLVVVIPRVISTYSAALGQF